MENNHKNYGYVFWNNTYENIWYAIPSEDYLLFFNGNRKNIKGVLKASTVEQLLTTIQKQK
jgi:hypothetical protein